MESICPNCGKHDNIYVRSGGRLVCRKCAACRSSGNANQEPNNVSVTKQARHTSAPPERT